MDFSPWRAPDPCSLMSERDLERGQFTLPLGRGIFIDSQKLTSMIGNRLFSTVTAFVSTNELLVRQGLCAHGKPNSPDLKYKI